MKEELDERFKRVFPQLVSTVKWKYDYIAFLKKEALSNTIFLFLFQ